jgi:hypothetical protein
MRSLCYSIIFKIGGFFSTIMPFPCWLLVFAKTLKIVEFFPISKQTPILSPQVLNRLITELEFG